MCIARIRVESSFRSPFIVAIPVGNSIHLLEMPQSMGCSKAVLGGFRAGQSSFFPSPLALGVGETVAQCTPLI